jgi:UDP-N-acetylmuramate: L-alanyl-gamma-D-glutamyl-meso-diaminopimelate ligase
VRGEVAGVTVIDDFAHHPTAVKGAIAALESRYPGRRLVAIFEPRTNTSRRRIFQDAYADALSGADHVVVFEVPDEPIYSATGEVTALFSSAELAEVLNDMGTPAFAFDTVDAIVEHVVAGRGDDDVVLVMSNGDFGNVWQKLLAALESAQG